RGQVHVILGGEHSISLGPIRAAKARFPSLGVLHFDAHGDLRDEYEGTRYGHGCVMRRVLESKVPIVQVGVRSLSSEEAAVTRRARPGAVERPPAGESLTFYAHDLASFGDALPAAIASCLPDPVYLSFDVDALDSSLMPATGTPEPGGLLWEPVLRIIDAAARARRIVAMDFVELMPRPGLHACEFLTARLAYRAIGSVVRARPAR
ncbi:MAG: arginase family protein, partial [Planctomycetota bacterium]